ncbi:hypothetical protein J26TS2_30490 [Shouchella clausii]|nr:hypothetical protein J26TS2_30490 [Shouchella clausii]
MKDYPQHYIVNVGGSDSATYRYYGDNSYVLCRAADLCTAERSLPRILTQLGVVTSTSEVRRNRADLVEDLPESPHFQRVNYGKRVIDIFVHSKKEAAE